MGPGSISFQIWRRAAARVDCGQGLVFHAGYPTAAEHDEKLEELRAADAKIGYVARDPDDRERPDARRTL